MKFTKRTLFFFLFTASFGCSLLNPVYAQTFYSYQGPDIIRAVNLTSNNSFCINANQLNSITVDSFLHVPTNKKLQWSNSTLSVSAVPITILYNNNSIIAAGINQGSLIPNRGNQKLFSGGIKVNWKNKITLQIAPEFQDAENIVFAKYPINSTDWEEYYYFLNRIDLPEQQGELPLKKWYPGQSFIKYHLKNIE